VKHSLPDRRTARDGWNATRAKAYDLASTFSPAAQAPEDEEDEALIFNANIPTAEKRGGPKEKQRKLVLWIIKHEL
jgi:hypothetical protein